MVYKALLVGINYYMQKDDALLSPLNNIELLRDFLISYAHFKEKDIVLLSDTSIYKNATFFSITSELKNLLKNSNKNDFIFIYFTGYGNYLDLLDPKTLRYQKEKMKRVSLYKKIDPNILFLPQDFHISTLTKEYFKSILNTSNSRLFLFFDCFNKTNILNFEYYYDIQTKQFIKNLKKNNWNTDIISLSSNTCEKKYFHEFFKINFINDKIKKFYSHFTIYFLKYLVDYLQLNVNFVTYTYKSMYEGLLKIEKDTQLSFSETEESIQNEVLDNLKKNCCCHDKNSLFLSFSHEKLINNNFLDTKIIEDKLVEEQKEKIETKLKYRDKSLAYMNSELERKVKILKVRNDNLSKQLINMKKNENKFLKFNF